MFILNKIIRLIWFFVSCIGYTFILSAQTTGNSFERIPVAFNGLEPVGVGAIVQDGDGYIWLGSSLGLFRYDGFDFKNYPYIADDSSSLFSEHVETLFLAKDGTLWVGSERGISRYIHTCDCFRNYAFEKFRLPQIGGHKGSMVVDIDEDPDENLWVIAQGGGLFRYDKKKDEFGRFKNELKDTGAFDQDMFRVLLADRKGKLWIGTGFGDSQNGKGLISLDPVSGEMKRHIHVADNPYCLMDNRISALMEDDKGRIWIGTYKNGLHIMDTLGKIQRLENNVTNPLGIYPPYKRELVWGNDPFVKIIHKDHKGDIWIGTTGEGIYHFKKGERDPIVYDPGKNLDESFRTYWTLYEDRQGLMWLGGISGSLYKMDLYGNQFQLYEDLKDVKSTVPSKKEESILWVVENDEIIKINTKTGNKEYFRDFAGRNTSICNNIQSLFEDSNGDIWIGVAKAKIDNPQCKDSGLYLLDQDRRKFIHYPIVKPSGDLISSNIFSIKEDERGHLWLAAGKNGLYRSDPKKLNFINVSISTDNHLERRINLVQKSGGFLWANDAGSKTLYRFDGSQKIFSPYLKGYRTSTITSDPNGTLWIGAEGHGLLKIDPENTITHFTIKDGLPGKHNVQVLESPDGYHWISTQNGLVRYNAEKNTFIPTRLISGFFHLGASKGMDGQLFFPTKKGLLAFYPNEVDGNPFPPDLIIRTISVNGDDILIDQKHTQNFTLKHDQNDISFAFNAFHFSDPEKNQFRYRLDPYDPDWIEVDHQRVARYTNLDFGNYKFILEGSNADGVWNREGKTLDFIIKAPWWKTWWARTLGVILLCAFMYSMYRLLLSRQLAIQKQKQLEEINKFKSELYTNITHEFRTPLTVILGMTDHLSSSLKKFPLNGASKSLELIRRNGHNLLHLVTEILDISRIESGHVKLHLIQSDVVSILKNLAGDFYSLAKDKDIRFQTTFDPESILMDNDQKKLERIVGNLLSNAFRYTEPGGQVGLKVTKETSEIGEHLTIKVKDSGIGIPKDEQESIFERYYRAKQISPEQIEGTGLGLAITREYIHMLGGSIQVRSNAGKGTSFMVKLPIHNKANLVITDADNNKSPLLPIHKATIDPITPGDSPSSDKPVLLIIEDNDDLRYYLHTILKVNYHCIIARDGDDGLQKALKHIPDIIICDVMLPKKNGFEICQELRLDIRTDHIPIIMLTAKVTQEDKLDGYRHGADAYITKPFEKEELLLRLSTMIETRKKLQIKYSSQVVAQEGEQETSLNPFIEKALHIIQNRLQDEEFSIEDLGEALYLSRSQLHRKIKALTGQSTTLFIRSIRLQKAKVLLESTDLSISEIAYRVGFKTPTYFSQIFKKEVGSSPVQFREKTI